MKKILVTTFLMLPGVLNAAIEETASPFPSAKKGINIMSMAEINVPFAMKSHILENKKALATKGYEETTETDKNVISLFALQRSAEEEIKQFDDDKNPLDTHLKSSVSKINLAFKFNEIPNLKKHNIIGYAAVGGYAKGKGWDGMVEFMSDPKLGVCSYTTYGIEKVILDKETTEYFVNDKPSNKSVAGNWNTGFLYTVNWYAPTRLMTLECANKIFDPNIVDNMIMLADRIDKA
ncbi:MAG: hypothetical protein P4M12_03135 [Gammaproteobacteria bacterium]|nr:hypothetical protein [Gammaproteobacteria bacterium]